LAAEFWGTFWFVLGGYGSAVLATAFLNVGIGFLGIATAFGLTVLTTVFAFSTISAGLWAGGRFPSRDLGPFIIVQVLGATARAAVLLLIASGKTGFDVSAGFASNGYGAYSPGGYSLAAALVTEVVTTCMFMLIILGQPTNGHRRDLQRPPLVWG
jgi:aquaporin Z